MKLGLVNDDADCVDDPLALALTGMSAARSLVVALKVGLIDAVRQTARTAGDLAEALDLDAAGVGVLLHMLESLGLVECFEDSWRILDAGQLDEGCEDLLRAASDQWHLLNLLEERVRGTEARDLHALSMPDGFSDRYQRALKQVALRGAPRLVERLGAFGMRPMRVLDVGGGHGAYAQAIAREWPAAEVIVLDQPDATAQGRRLGDGTVEYRSGDLRDGDWGVGFDLILLINVTPHLTLSELDGAMLSAATALAPDGHLVVLQPSPSVSSGTDVVQSTRQLLFYAAASRAMPAADSLVAAMQQAGMSVVETSDDGAELCFMASPSAGCANVPSP